MPELYFSHQALRRKFQPQKKSVANMQQLISCMQQVPMNLKQQILSQLSPKELLARHGRYFCRTTYREILRQKYNLPNEVMMGLYDQLTDLTAPAAFSALASNYEPGTKKFDLLAHGIRTNNLPLVHSVIEYSECHLTFNVFSAAIANGNIAILARLLQQRTPDGAEAFTVIAAKHGQLQLLQWLVAHGYELNSHTLDAALENGQLAIIKYLPPDYNIYWLHRAMRLAVVRSYLPILKWLLLELRYNLRPALVLAVEHNKVAVLQLLHRYYAFDKELFAAAVKNCEHTDVIEYLCQVKCPWDIEAIEAAIGKVAYYDSQGRFLQLLLIYGYPFKPETIQKLWHQADEELNSCAYVNRKANALIKQNLIANYLCREGTLAK